MRAGGDGVALATVEAAWGLGILPALVLLLRGAEDRELLTITVLLGSEKGPADAALRLPPPLDLTAARRTAAGSAKPSVPFSAALSSTREEDLADT